MTAELALATDPSALEALEPAARELAVTQYLSDARSRLALALEATGPAAVAALKAEIATAAEATKQLGLSREIQQDAQEMVRRAEYALGKAIRAGQEAGEIRERGQRANAANQHGASAVPGDNRNSTASPYDFAKPDELHGNGDGNIYALADGVTEAEFEAALSDAKAEGNLSRANVVRKVKGVKSEGLTPVERLRKIRELAPSGMSSGQIAREVGVTEETVRDVARRNNITITADEVLRGTRRSIDSNRIVNETVMTLDAMLTPLRLVNFDDLDVEQAENWASSLTNSLRALNRFAKQIKEMTQ